MWVFGITDDYIFGGDSTGNVWVWETGSCQFLRKIPSIPGFGGIFSMYVLEKEKRIVISGTASLFTVLDFNGDRLWSVKLPPIDGNAEMIRGIAVHPQYSNIIFTGSQLGRIQCWDMKNMVVEWEKIVDPKSRVLNELIVSESYVLTSGISLKCAWLDIRTVDGSLVCSLDLPFNGLHRSSRVYHIHALPGQVCLAAGSISYYISVRELRPQNSSVGMCNLS
eukprot:TRINITY_DN8312_c0_g2_i1.p1 TRINITY_DN8312_c0_g2~~TRINITY_DN8312_c0_g2_i1.p1  ORF type:complete len:222 (+),score=39.23 TRINITY_DN8312_c0_g2_i1:237-902(+)